MAVIEGRTWLELLSPPECERLLREHAEDREAQHIGLRHHRSSRHVVTSCCNAQLYRLDTSHTVDSNSQLRKLGTLEARRWGRLGTFPPSYALVEQTARSVPRASQTNSTEGEYT